jgi:hypothetical protein
VLPDLVVDGLALVVIILRAPPRRITCTRSVACAGDPSIIVRDAWSVAGRAADIRSANPQSAKGRKGRARGAPRLCS